MNWRYLMMATVAVLVGCDDAPETTVDEGASPTTEASIAADPTDTAATSSDRPSPSGDERHSPPPSPNNRSNQRADTSSDGQANTPAPGTEAADDEGSLADPADDEAANPSMATDDAQSDVRDERPAADSEATSPDEPGEEPMPASEAPQPQETEVAMDRPAVGQLRRPLDDESRLTIRPLRRMNVDQLNAAMRSVSGGIGWTERRNNTDVDLFEQLASTLGKPDYAFATDEELEPTVIFQKFLDDAARSICGKMLTADLQAFEAEANGEPVEGAPKLLIHVGPDDTLETAHDAVVRNLQTLLRRFHGRVIVDAEAPLLHHWQWLHRTGSFVTGDPAEAWLGVCVALFTHPHFYMY
ncbi:MAG: hypothetical protein VX589_06580 [Myxococcota bacterium]|nr:hypothetical protein [Myxococcota bacterium]